MEGLNINNVKLNKYYDYYMVQSSKSDSFVNFRSLPGSSAVHGISVSTSLESAAISLPGKISGGRLNSHIPDWQTDFTWLTHNCLL